MASSKVGVLGYKDQRYHLGVIERLKHYSTFHRRAAILGVASYVEFSVLHQNSSACIYVRHTVLCTVPLKLSRAPFTRTNLGYFNPDWNPD